MKSYLRFLSRNKLYTAIMVVGLSIALAFVLLIGTYVWQQYSVARNCDDFERIYSIGRSDENVEVLGLRFDSPEILQANIPEIELACCYYNIYESPVKLDGEAVPAENVCADKSFFEMFGIKFLYGSADVFDDLSNVVVSESFANAHGGVDKIIGKKIQKHGSDQIVAGVIEDFDNELFAYCDIVHNIKLRGRPVQYIHDSYTFIKLHEGVRIEEVDDKIKAEVQKIFDSSPFKLGYTPFILRYDEVFFAGHTDFLNCLNNADSRTLKIMLAVVLVLLFSAMVNFINLSTAMSGKRIKEMATRMVSGADKESIFRRYVTESVGLSVLCMTAALLTAITFEPYVNQLIQSDIPIKISLSPDFILIYLAVGLAIGLTASFLPASIGISTHPMNALKGQFKADSKRVFGKIFIVLQNAVSIVLIALAIMMELQMRHLSERPVGADIDDLYYLWMDDIKQRGPLEDELKNLPFVTRIGLSEGYPGGLVESILQTEPGKRQVIGMLICDIEAFEMYDFQRKTDNGYELGNTVWMTQKSYDRISSYAESKGVSNMNLIVAGPDTRTGGILHDFAIFDALTDISDSWCVVRVDETRDFRPFMSDGAGILIETTGNHSENRKAIEKVYRKYSEERYGIFMEPMTYGYINDQLAGTLSETDSRMKIMELFMFLSILLSFMGLVAMSTYYSSERTSDIAIRKVYGSTIEEETFGSIWKYMKIVIVSCIIAVPVAVYVCGRYLSGFAYRIDNYWWVYMLAIILALLISLAAVFVQISRAARTNPADVLKKE